MQTRKLPVLAASAASRKRLLKFRWARVSKSASAFASAFALALASASNCAPQSITRGERARPNRSLAGATCCPKLGFTRATTKAPKGHKSSRLDSNWDLNWDLDWDLDSDSDSTRLDSDSDWPSNWIRFDSIRLEFEFESRFESQTAIFALASEFEFATGSGAIIERAVLLLARLAILGSRFSLLGWRAV